MLNYNRLHEFKESYTTIPKPSLFLGTLLLVLAVSYANLKLSESINIHLLYIFPIVFISWSRNRNYGYAVAIITLLLWALSDFFSGSIISVPITIFNLGLRSLVFFSLITIVKVLNRMLNKLREESHTDFLTSLKNIRSFYDEANMELERMRRNNQPFSLVYMDIDNFKKVNDTMGHLVGDSLLIEVGRVMKENCRKIDCVARLGGDEFVILLSNTTQIQAKLVMVNMLEKLASTMEKNNWPVSFSVGVKTFTEPPESIESIVKETDSLMYSVKTSGKNNIVFK